MRTRRGIAWAILTGLAASLAVQVNGCTIIGVTAGGIVDARTPRHQQVRASEVVRVPPGSRVALQLRDSTRVRGVYRGSVRIGDDVYQPLYRDWRARHPRGADFPEIGESIRLERRSHLTFRAFLAEGVEVRDRRRGVEVIESLGVLERADGRRLDLLDASALALDGELPLATAMRVRTDAGERTIALDQVAWIDASTKRSGAVRGLLVGLVADAIVVATLSQARAQTFDCTSSSGGPVFLSGPARSAGGGAGSPNDATDGPARAGVAESRPLRTVERN